MYHICVCKSALGTRNVQLMHIYIANLLVSFYILGLYAIVFGTHSLKENFLNGCKENIGSKIK